MPIGPPPGDEKGLAHGGAGHDRMHRVAEGVVDGGPLGIDPFGHAPEVGLGHGDIVGEAAVAVHAQDDHVLAEVGVAGAALEALVADHVHLGGDQVADPVMTDVGAGFHDGAVEFVARRDRGLEPVLGPLVPLVYMQVGAADGPFVDLDQDFIGLDGRDGDLLHFQPGARASFSSTPSWCQS